jgi:methyl acetate hydrolase
MIEASFTKAPSDDGRSAGQPQTLDSVFRIASMTKALTGTAATQLVQKGRIGLEQPISDVLPLLRGVKALEGFDVDGTPRLRDPTSPITLPHVLTHTLVMAMTSSTPIWLVTSGSPGCPASSAVRTTP